MSVRIHHGDCLNVLDTLEADSVHAVVTDPPYHLLAGKGEAANGASPDKKQREVKGFMGMKWDGGAVAFDPATWVKVLRVMKPGAYLVAFGGTRTYHRLACAIEDAGFEIRDQLGWMFGTGFPKGTDKAKIPEAWQGFNTALKPAWEPIVLARKPYPGTLAVNLEAHGCGALNIDGCRIAVEDEQYARNCSGDRGHEENRERVMDFGMTAGKASKLGRWPANLMHDGSDEVLAHFPDDAGAAAPVHRRSADKFSTIYGEFKGCVDEEGSTFQGDRGSAARFFYCPKADREDREHGLSDHEKKPLLWSSGEKSPGTFQSPNTDRSARNHHPTVKPTELMRWLVRLVTPLGGSILDPFMGSGSTGRAATLESFDFIGIEAEAKYVELARARIGIVDIEEFRLGAA